MERLVRGGSRYTQHDVLALQNWYNSDRLTKSPHFTLDKAICTSFCLGSSGCYRRFHSWVGTCRQLGGELGSQIDFATRTAYVTRKFDLFEAYSNEAYTREIWFGTGAGGLRVA